MVTTKQITLEIKETTGRTFFSKFAKKNNNKNNTLKKSFQSCSGPLKANQDDHKPFWIDHRKPGCSRNNFQEPCKRFPIFWQAPAIFQKYYSRLLCLSIYLSACPSLSLSLSLSPCLFSPAIYIFDCFQSFHQHFSQIYPPKRNLPKFVWETKK